MHSVWKSIVTLLVATALCRVAWAKPPHESVEVDNTDPPPVDRAAGASTIGPLVLDEPKLFGPFQREGLPYEIYYLAQKAKNGIIDLTANNGFYNGFEGSEKSGRTPPDDGLMPVVFQYLKKNRTDPAPAAVANKNQEPPATEVKEGAPDENPAVDDDKFHGARWHLYCSQPGEIKLTFYMKVTAAEAEFAWPVSLGTGSLPLAEMTRETKTLKLAESTGESAQPAQLTFTVKKAGRVSVLLDADRIPAAAGASIRYIRAEGLAIEKARLLRARFRPSAVHVGFTAPANCPEPTMWVFESKDVSKTGGYSPLTTPFGYYGLVFHDGYVPAGAGFNFSMWASSRGATEAPPLECMPRLIATDLRDAEFSSFGHEGTGVKLRGDVYTVNANSAIQALRVTVDGEVTTYYGYFYDEPTQRWRLYCAGQDPPKKGRKPTRILARTGSFLEIPGAPGRQMSGDIVRTTARRGWFYGSDGKFYPAMPGNSDSVPAEATEEPMNAAASGPKQTATADGALDAFTLNKMPENRMHYTINKGNTSGWFATTTGGMEYYSRMEPPKVVSGKAELPEYLQPEKVKGLFHLPVVFGESKVTPVGANERVVNYELKQTSPHSRAVLYYGTVDCLTFVGNGTGELKRGTPTQKAMVAKDRTWQAHTPEQDVKAGVNQFRLTNLKANTTYYYRLYVEHDAGKSWDYASGSIQTP